MTALTIIDWLLVLALLLPVLYLFLFAAFSMRRRTDDYPPGAETAAVRVADPPPTRPTR